MQEGGNGTECSEERGEHLSSAESTRRVIGRPRRPGAASRLCRAAVLRSSRGQRTRRDETRKGPRSPLCSYLSFAHFLFFFMSWLPPRVPIWVLTDLPGRQGTLIEMLAGQMTASLHSWPKSHSTARRCEAQSAIRAARIRSPLASECTTDRRDTGSAAVRQWHRHRGLIGGATD